MLRIIDFMPQSSAGAAATIGEFDLIRRLTDVLGVDHASDRERRALVGIGDDCAVFPGDSAAGLLTADAMVDGVHFRRGEIDWYDLGWKALVSNQSDVAAMGGVPEFALVTLGLPEGFSPVQVESMYRGIRAAAEEFGGEVVGGDVVRSPALFISVSLYGRAAQSSSGEALLLRRDRARAGDRVAVTGPLGGSAGGLRALAEGRTSEDAERLKRAHFSPRAKVDAGRVLAANGVECAIDVSDGLLSDLSRICESSGAAAEIEAGLVPFPAALEREFPTEWLDLALTGGEDYELIVVAPEETFGRMGGNVGGELHVIGDITGPSAIGEPLVAVVDLDGSRFYADRAGWDHFRG